MLKYVNPLKISNSFLSFVLVKRSFFGIQSKRFIFFYVLFYLCYKNIIKIVTFSYISNKKDIYVENNMLCWPSPNQTGTIYKLGNVSACLPVPDHIQRPEYAGGLPNNVARPHGEEPDIKPSDDILRMRESCQLTSSILKKCRSVVQVIYSRLQFITNKSIFKLTVFYQF